MKTAMSAVANSGADDPAAMKVAPATSSLTSRPGKATHLGDKGN